MARLGLQDTALEALVKLAAGNPGAATVLAQLAQKEDGIGLVHCFKFDDMEIYGSRIWMCYKDLCGCDIDGLYQLLCDNELNTAIGVEKEIDKQFEQEWEYCATVEVDDPQIS